eukprot:SAG31_NODE_1601_length_7786_cov_33.553272_3_plen_58_part_00
MACFWGGRHTAHSIQGFGKLQDVKLSYTTSTRVSEVTFSFLRQLLEKYGTFIERMRH